MLRSEFESRVGIQVSAEEFNGIHEEYMNTPYDKDDFCKAWTAIHWERVKAARKTIKDEEDFHKKQQKLLSQYDVAYVHRDNIRDGSYVEPANLFFYMNEEQIRKFWEIAFSFKHDKNLSYETFRTKDIESDYFSYGGWHEIVFMKKGRR